jgi:hypothetical protein
MAPASRARRCLLSRLAGAGWLNPATPIAGWGKPEAGCAQARRTVAVLRGPAYD